MTICFFLSFQWCDWTVDEVEDV